MCATRASDIAIGATTKQCVVENDPVVRAKLPLLAKVMPFVGHTATRARGTVGGSLVNGDPAAEIVLVAVTLGATLIWRDGGADNPIAAADFFLGPMVTALPLTACLAEARFPVWPEARVGVGFHEINARQSDFAFVSAAAQIALDDEGRCIRAAIGIGAATAVPLRLDAVAEALKGQALRRSRGAKVAQRGARRHRSDGGSARLGRVSKARCRDDGGSCHRRCLSRRREARMKVELDINREKHTVDVEPRTSLLDCLRDKLLLTGAHAGCEHGVCGACTVLVDGAAVRSCLMFAVQADGYAITTIEGLSPGPGELSPLQDAFCETHGMQCGYCTPAMILAAHALLSKNTAPTREEIVDAISGNICRCTGYAQIVEAIALAAERMRGQNIKPDQP